MNTDDIPKFASEAAYNELPAQERPFTPATRLDASSIVFGAIRIGLHMLGRNALLILTAASSFVLFGYAILHPSALTIATACLFSALVFLPILWTSQKSK